MELVIPTNAQAANGSIPQELTHKMVQMCVRACHAFLDWERSDFINAPDGKTRLKHRQTLTKLLRLTRLLLAEALDPEYPDPTSAAELEAVIWKLNESWESFYHAMPEAEAEKLLQEYFPGHGS